MARRNRQTLKKYFATGSRPSGQAFEDLIDSALNTLDDGFMASPERGLELTPLTDEGVIISTFKNSGDSEPVWKIAIDKKSGDLQIKSYSPDGFKPVLTLSNQSGSVLNKQTDSIHLGGTLHLPARKGSYKSGRVKADGKWHDLLGQEEYLEEGCWAFEVTAGCGEKNKGRYALITAIAMHCFGSRPKIRKIASTFGFKGNRICIRWVKVKDKFTCKLQMKTFFRYSEGTEIEYAISLLWDNPQMI